MGPPYGLPPTWCALASPYPLGYWLFSPVDNSQLCFMVGARHRNFNGTSVLCSVLVWVAQLVINGILGNWPTSGHAESHITLNEKAYFSGRGSKSSLESTMPISTRRFAARACGASPLARGSDLPKPLVVIRLGLIPARTRELRTAWARRPESFKL